MADCPYCGELIDEKWNFCRKCKQQVKCISCKSYLIENETMCLNCGTLLQKSASTTTMNTFSLEEKQTGNSYSRKVDLSFTDNAIDKVADLVYDHIPLNLAKGSRQLPKQKKSSLPASENENIEQDDKQENGEVIETNIKEISDHELASNYFEQDGNGLLSQRHSDYKGKSSARKIYLSLCLGL